MPGFISCGLDQQVFLKFHGNLRMDAMGVELEILTAGDRNRTSGIIAATIPVPPQLASRVQHHWETNYRRYCKGGRAIVMKDINFTRPTRQTCDDSAQALSTLFNSWLHGPEFRDLRETLIDRLDKNDQIQFLIQSDDLRLQQLPWPAWDLFRRYPNASIDTTSPQAKPHPLPPRTAPRLRILGIVGASDRLDTASDRALLEALPPHLVEVQILHQPRLYELTDHLWEQAWDMIVFAGHGDTDAAGQGFLELNDEGELLRFNEIWYGLRKAVRSGLQLALFNSCFGLGLLAQNLQDDAQIPHMIVMRDLVPDAIAQAFLNYFLQDFVAGEPIPVAANRARERLQALEPQYPCATWLPVIWQNPYALPLGLGVVRKNAGQNGSTQTTKDESTIASPTLRSPQRKPILLTCGLLCASLLIVFGGRGSVARWLNAQGVQASDRDQLLTAQRYFEIARRLDPRYPQPRYNLGFLYDQRWGRREEAIAHYEAAAYLDHPAAIAEYIRFKLLKGDEDYGPMLTLIKRCLDRAEYPSIRVSCLKNKGWIRVRQQRWTRAEAELTAAIALLDQSAHTHCLLAQTLEAQGKTAQALPHWQKTLEFGQDEIDEHDRCLGVAETRLLTLHQDASTTHLHPLNPD